MSMKYAGHAGLKPTSQPIRNKDWNGVGKRPSLPSGDREPLNEKQKLARKKKNKAARDSRRRNRQGR